VRTTFNRASFRRKLRASPGVREACKLVTRFHPNSGLQARKRPSHDLYRKFSSRSTPGNEVKPGNVRYFQAACK
jgi:hypothetical protein